MSTTTDVHVIGGGLAGLTAAALVARAGHTVTVHESRNRLGGRATTDEHDGFRFNQGPHALYRGGPATDVLRELGITPRGATPPLAGSMALDDGVLELLVVGPGSLARTGLLGSRDKLQVGRLLTRIPRMRAADHAGQTVIELLDELTDRPRVRALLLALTRLATYVDAPAVLSAEAAVMQLQAALADGVLYLDHGWEQLVEAVATTTPAVAFARGERVVELPDAGAVIVAAGGPAAASALTGFDYGDAITAGASVLDLGLSTPPPHDFVLGIDRSRYLSNHGTMAGMTPTGRSSVSVAAYLAPGAEAAGQDDLRAYARATGVADDTVVSERYLHRMTVVTAIPTAATGGLAGRPGVAVPDRPGVFVAGDWVGRRGHLVDAVLASAAEAARAAVAHLARRPVLG